MHPKASAPAPVRTPKTYLVIWGGVASLALAYLTLVALRPDLAETLLPTSVHTTRDGAVSERFITRTQADMRTLKQTIADLERTVTDLKTGLTLQEDRTTQVSARLAAFEVATQPLLARAQEWMATSLAAKAGGSPAPALASGPSAEIVTGSLPRTAKPAEAPKQRDQGETRGPPTTGTGEAAAAPAATPAPKPEPVALRLGTGPSLDALRLNWQLLQEGHRDALKPLRAKYIEAAADPQTFRLIAGPVASRGEAQRMCERLKARRVTCEIGAFDGEPL